MLQYDPTLYTGRDSHYLPAWRENLDVWHEAEQAAVRLGCIIRHNWASQHSFYGYHRYVALLPNATDISCRSRSCVVYTEAPYSRQYLPSKRGEREALQYLTVLLEREREGEQ